MENLNDKIFELHAEGVKAGRIAQKLKVKKAVVMDILGEAGKSGLGDIVEAVTEATGIKKAVEAITDDCGCAARKEKLNKLFPRRKLNDLSNEAYIVLDTFFNKKQSTINRVEQSMLLEIYNDVFNAKREMSSCSPCVASMVKELRQIYDGVTKD